MSVYFITGGMGFLGQYIVQGLHTHDPAAELRVLARTQRKTFLNLEKLDRIQWTRGELTQPESFAAQLAGVDTVIHSAALVSFKKSDAEKIIEANVIGTRNLAQAAREAGCRNFIFISSISAIAFRPPQITDETMLPDLEEKRRNDVYGYSKRVSEIELQDMSRDMRVIILNPSVILGPGSREIAKAANATRHLPIVPMLSYINSFVDARDVTRAVTLALTKGRSGERYIVSGANAGMIEFTQMVIKAMGRKAAIVPISGGGIQLLDGLLTLLGKLRLDPGIRRLAEMNINKPCSSEKIQREMGWTPSFSLEQSIQDSFTIVTK